METEIKKILEMAVANGATDVHLIPGLTPGLRVGGEVREIEGLRPVTGEEIKEMLSPILPVDKKNLIEEIEELDFSFSLLEARCRVNVYRQQGGMAAAFRLIPLKVPGFEELGLPSVFESFVDTRQGFILVTGPTGHGKSTTVASILSRIAQKRAGHIVTIEDPIEYLIEAGKSIVSQRQVGTDTKDFSTALKSVLRQDPDVVFLGEMRDLPAIASALTVAETGHLVFSTLHTNSASQAVDRIIDVFPEGTKEQIRMQLAATLTAVVSERLVPKRDGGVVAVFEVMTGTSAVKNSIREGKAHLLDNIIQTSGEAGMMTLEFSLARLVKTGVIDEEMAMNFCLRPSVLQTNLRGDLGRG